MAALVEGIQYGLQSQRNSLQNKTIVLVKLTDSSSRTIQDFLKSKPQRPPSFQFHGNQGLLVFPSSPSDKPLPQFGFTLSAVEVDGPQGSFECLQHPGNKGLHSIGGIQYKMQIHASEDSYEKTRVKMAVVEQESKKNCTKVIKSAGPYLGRKVKVKRPAPLLPPKPVSPSPLSFSSSSAKPCKTPPPVPPSSIHKSFSNSIASGGPVKAPNNNTEITTKNIRDRIVHLLALSPYKIPELKAKLIKEGVKDAEKKSLIMVLKTIATSKEGVYHLSRNSWNHVQETWPFYSPEERETVKRRKAQNLAPTPQPEPAVDNSNSPIYHSNSSPGQVTPYPTAAPSVVLTGGPQKRQAPSLDFNSKKQKPSSGYQAPPPAPKPMPLANGRTSNGLPLRKNESPYKNGHRQPPQQNGFHHQKLPRPNGSLTSPDSSPESSRDSIADSENLYPDDFSSKYGAIISTEQRTQYKADFNADYEEYRSLHTQIDQITKKFAALDQSLHNVPEGSDEYKRLRQEIYKEYDENKRNLNYDQMVARFRYLHDKLTHIKRLVISYDQSQAS